MPGILHFAISIGVGIAVWVLTEVFYPRAFPNTAPSAKRYWGFFFFILSTILTESIQAAYRLEQRVDAISVSFRSLTDSEAEAAFKDIYQSYYANFRKPDERIKTWVKKAITDLRDELASGYVSMSPESGRNEMSGMFGKATKWVVATNVGSLEFFLGNTAYQDLNHATFDRGVPVIRFFLYGSPPRRSGHEDADPRFRSKAIESMKKMYTVCGILIHAETVSSSISDLQGPQDFLLVDNSFVAHAELNTNTWEILRIRATIQGQHIVKYRQYLYDLQGMAAKEVICLDQINDNGFNGKAELEKKMGKRTGQQIFSGTMEEIGRTKSP